MGQGDSSEIFVSFVLGGKPIAGESLTEIDIPGRTRHPFLAEFGPGRMFEIDSFTFSVGTEDDDKSAAKPGQPAPQPAAGAHGRGKPAARPAVKYQAWRAGRTDVKYPVSVQPIVLTRAIDRASTSLLQYFIDSVSFDKVVLVKRKAAGSGAAGEPFLRMDFNGVLITKVSWTNDDPVKEVCELISRRIVIQYRPQLPDGTLGGTIMRQWSMLDGLKPS